jgi:hypothetical protein
MRDNRQRKPRRRDTKNVDTQDKPGHPGIAWKTWRKTWKNQDTRSDLLLPLFIASLMDVHIFCHHIHEFRHQDAGIASFANK